MFSTVGDMIWTARRVHRHKRDVRRMLDPRYYERHGRSRWLPDESQARRLLLAQFVVALALSAGFVAALLAWCEGVI